MNEYQKEEIRRLRTEGLGYKKISTILNINLNTVKSYCRQNNLLTKDLPPTKCKECNKGIKKKEKKKQPLFCSDKCRMRWWNKNRDKRKSKLQEVKKCENCKLEYMSYPKELRRFCSHRCYVNYRFQKGVFEKCS